METAHFQPFWPQMPLGSPQFLHPLHWNGKWLCTQRNTCRKMDHSKKLIKPTNKVAATYKCRPHMQDKWELWNKDTPLAWGIGVLNMFLTLTPTQNSRHIFATPHWSSLKSLLSWLFYWFKDLSWYPYMDGHLKDANIIKKYLHCWNIQKNQFQM